MRVEIAAEAKREATEVRAHYAAASERVAAGFAHELEHAIQQIQDNPLLWQEITKRTRRYVMEKFPYVVVYRLGDDVIRIVAVAHQRRRTSYWRKR